MNKHRPSQSRYVRRRLSRGGGLRQAARAAAARGDQRAQDWLHNKSVNTKRPKLGIGRTRAKKGKHQAPALSKSS